MLVSHCPVGKWRIWLRLLSLTWLRGRWEQDTPPYVCHVTLELYNTLLFPRQESSSGVVLKPLKRDRRL